MSLWQSYRNLSPRTRMLFGGGIMAWAAIGMLVTDRFEQAFGMTPTEEDQKNLREAVPKIHFVERDGK